MKKLLIALGVAIMALATSCTPDAAGVDGRWNGYREDRPDDYFVSCFFKDNSSVEMWIIAWGEKYTGTYTVNGSNLTVTVDKAWRSEKRDGNSREWGMANGSITSQETFALGEGFQWYPLEGQEFEDRHQEISDTFTIVLDSATTGHGTCFGFQLSFSKAK